MIKSFFMIFMILVILAFVGCDNGTKSSGTKDKTDPTTPTEPTKDKNDLTTPNESKSNVLVDIKAGTFDMQRTKHGDPTTTFKMPMKTFSIGKYPVTQEEWTEVMGDEPFKDEAPKRVGEKKPVFRVSFYDALKYLNKLSEMNKLELVYVITETPDKNSPSNPSTFSATGNHSKNGYRLPSEAEWQYAALAGKSAKFYTDNRNEYAWDDSGQNHDVGGKKANDFGFHDMLGGVWEFLWTNPAAAYPTTKELQDNYPVAPVGDAVFGIKILGGVFGRAGHHASSPSGSWGFRIAKNK